MGAAATEIYTSGHTLALHDALPIWVLHRNHHPRDAGGDQAVGAARAARARMRARFERDVNGGSARRIARRGERHCFGVRTAAGLRSEEHTSELQSLMRISYAVFCLKKKTTHTNKLLNTDSDQ